MPLYSVGSLLQLGPAGRAFSCKTREGADLLVGKQGHDFIIPYLYASSIRSFKCSTLFALCSLPGALRNEV